MGGLIRNECKRECLIVTVLITRLGRDRSDGEGPRIGTVRRPPRGIPKDEYAARNLYDVWFPNLAPTAALLKQFFPINEQTEWRMFKRRFLAEMKHQRPASTKALPLAFANSAAASLLVVGASYLIARLSPLIVVGTGSKTGADYLLIKS